MNHSDLLIRCPDNAKVDSLLKTGILFRIPASDYRPLVSFLVQSGKAFDLESSSH